MRQAGSDRDGEEDDDVEMEARPGDDHDREENDDAEVSQADGEDGEEGDEDDDESIYDPFAEEKYEDGDM